MLHQILTNLDTNNQSESIAVLMGMIDWSQAFDRQSHKLGVQSFIDNGVRPALIPVLLNFFQDRTMQVKWKGKLSSSRSLPGGGPQGGTLGIIEYKSQSDDNTEFLGPDEKLMICQFWRLLISFWGESPLITTSSRCPRILEQTIYSWVS